MPRIERSLGKRKTMQQFLCPPAVQTRAVLAPPPAAQTRAALAPKFSNFPLVISIRNSFSQSSPESSVSPSSFPSVPGAYQLRAAAFLKGRSAGEGAAQWARSAVATLRATKVTLSPGCGHPALFPLGPTWGDGLKEDCHTKATFPAL